MKTLYIISLTLLAGCTQLGQRVAYGPNYRQVITAPKTPTEAVQEAIQVKKEVDQYGKDVKGQARPEKEDKYAAIQEKENLQAKYIEMHNNYVMLREELTDLKTKNAELHNDNNRLAIALSSSDRQIEALKTTQSRLSDSFTDLSGRLTTIESIRISKPTVAMGEVESPTKTSVSSVPAPSHGVVNLGSMVVDGNTSVRKAQNGTVSVYSGSSHTTYTPRATYTPRSSHQYHLGPRGGCYYYTGSGRKEYVDRSLCH